VVVDASVWISRVIRSEPFHEASRTWLIRQSRSGIGIAVPSLALPEVGGALARRTGEPVESRAALAWITRIPSLRVIDLDQPLVDHATQLAIDLRLRGADAVYVALAARLSLPLVTWDQELLERAASRIEVRTPEPG
jgi:predicted nucleic acid-binding protein